MARTPDEKRKRKTNMLWIPIVLTGAVLAGTYLTRTPPAATPPASTQTRALPPAVAQRASALNASLPPNLQIPQAQWGDPQAWQNLAHVLINQPGQTPGSPQITEVLAIENLVRSLPLPMPPPGPGPGPGPGPLGTIVLTPALQAQLSTALATLPPQFRQIPGLPPLSGQFTPSAPPIPIDPNAILVLAQSIQAQYPQQAGTLQQIVAQAQASTPSGGGMGASSYEQIIRAQGGGVTPEMSNVLSYLQAQGGAPPPPNMSGLARFARVGRYARYGARPMYVGACAPCDAAAMMRRRRAAAYYGGVSTY